jgi:hypothetical protein
MAVNDATLVVGEVESLDDEGGVEKKFLGDPVEHRSFLGGWA